MDEGNAIFSVFFLVGIVTIGCGIVLRLFSSSFSKYFDSEPPASDLELEKLDHLVEDLNKNIFKDQSRDTESIVRWLGSFSIYLGFFILIISLSYLGVVKLIG